MKPLALMIIQYARNVERALAFCRDAIGLDLVEARDGWAKLKCDGGYLALHGPHPAMIEHPVPFAGLNLQVEDLDLHVARALAAGAQLKEIVEPERGIPIRLAVMIDPEGNGFELHQRVEVRTA